MRKYPPEMDVISSCCPGSFRGGTRFPLSNSFFRGCILRCLHPDTNFLLAGQRSHCYCFTPVLAVYWRLAFGKIQFHFVSFPFKHMPHNQTKSDKTGNNGSEMQVRAFTCLERVSDRPMSGRRLDLSSASSSSTFVQVDTLSPSFPGDCCPLLAECLFQVGRRLPADEPRLPITFGTLTTAIQRKGL